MPVLHNAYCVFKYYVARLNLEFLFLKLHGLELLLRLEQNCISSGFLDIFLCCLFCSPGVSVNFLFLLHTYILPPPNCYPMGAIVLLELWNIILYICGFSITSVVWEFL